MALNGRRGTLQAFDFQHVPSALQPPHDMLAHDFAHLVVIGTDESGIFWRIGLALKDDDGHATVEGTVDGGRNGCHLIGSDDEQLDTAGHQRVYLLNLPLVVVIGRCKAQLHILLEIGTHAHLGILLVAPDVARALRHPDDVAWLLSRTTGQGQHDSQQYI